MSQSISSTDQDQDPLPQAALKIRPVSEEHAEHATGPPAARGPMRWIPTVAIFCVLAALGYWGHKTDWKLTSFSQLSGQAATPDKAWCEAHNVAEADCLACQPQIVPVVARVDWCVQHGLNPCPLCHPEVIQMEEQPTIPVAEIDRVAAALQLRERPENNPSCPLNAQSIQFASIAAVKKAGVDYEPVERNRVVEFIEANGEITYDRRRLARLSSRVKGTLWRVEKNVGDRAKRGEVLALIEAAEVGRAKSDLLDALANISFQQKTLDSLQPLAAEQIIPEYRLLAVETKLQRAKIKLRGIQQVLINLGFAIDTKQLAQMSTRQREAEVQFLGLPSAIRETLDAETTTSNLLPLLAPLDGVVIECDAVAGEVVGTESVLFQLTDISRMWLVFNVSMEDAHLLKRGQTVKFRGDGSRNEVQGILNWISTDVNRETRTVTVRANLENPTGRLKSETFGQGRIILREDPAAIVVPTAAVQWDGNCHVVFVRDKNFFDKSKPTLFHTRQVRTGVVQNGSTEIIAGLWPGEVVVTQGSGVLRSQILKDNLGAGCTCGH